MNWQEILKAFIDGLKEQLAGKTEDEQKKILQAATDALPQEARQFIHDVGHSAATATWKAKVKEVETERDTLKTDKASLETKVTELQAKNPDAAAVRQEMEKKLTDKDEAHAAEKAKWKQERQNLEVGTFATAAKAAFVAAGVDPDYADLRVEKLIKDGRIKPTDGDDGATVISVYKADGATPFAALQGKSLAASLVEAELETIDDKWKGSGVGGGAGALGGNGGAGGSKSAAHFESIRNDVKGKQGDTGAEMQKQLGIA